MMGPMAPDPAGEDGLVRLELNPEWQNLIAAVTSCLA